MRAHTDFTYIKDLRASNERAAAQRGRKKTEGEVALKLHLTGHLFDKKVINQVRYPVWFVVVSFPAGSGHTTSLPQILDMIESSSVTCEVLSATVGKSASMPSTITLQLFAPHDGALHDIKVQILDTALAHDVQVAGGACVRLMELLSLRTRVYTFSLSLFAVLTCS